MPNESTKWCPHCATTKPTEEFGRNATRPDGLSFHCLECNRQRNRAFYRAKRERMGFELRTRDPSPPGFKRCAGCRQVGAVDDFHRHTNTKDGRVGYCKDCRADMGRRGHLKRNYGLDEHTLAQLIADQGGVCAICQVRTAAHVDHDHTSGSVRGVLCFRCNVAIGHLQDDPYLMRRASHYLERTGTPQCLRVLEEPGVYRVITRRSAAAASPSFSPLLRRISSPPV